MQTKFQRRKIHTRVKFLTYMNALPEQYKSQLHPSQIYRYKTTFNETAYFGYELSSIEQSLIGALQQLNQHATDRKIMFACLRLLVILRQVFSKAKHFNSPLSKGKVQIVEIVQRYHSVIPVARFASLLKVSESTIRQWVRLVRVQCSHTITNLCRKTHPNQLLESEVQVMKQLLTSELYKHWPLVSIYYEALTKNVVAMCLSTWYKYVQLLGINRLRPKRSKVYGKSIVASRPNEVWHADVTQFRTLDGTLHYIYLVVDNYSKHVLAWAIDTVLSGVIRTRTFKVAVKTAATSFFTAGSVQLVVDGGSENNNKTVDAFISELEDIELTKVIALKTVSFSNAMAEATNRILKTYYLNQQPLYNTAALMAATERAIYDITVVRPHGQLGGLTPYLAYNGQKADSLRLSQYKMTARLNRIAANQNSICCKGKF